MDTFHTIVGWAQIIVLPVTAVAIILFIILYRPYRHHAELSCIFDSHKRPVKVKAGPGLAGNIEVWYLGQPVDTLYVARANVLNFGDVPIRASDIVEPLTFTFGPEAILLDQPHVTDPNPPELRLDWSVETPEAPSPPTATVKFALPNPGDRFAAEFIYTGDPTLPRVSAHIVGTTIALWPPARPTHYLTYALYFVSGVLVTFTISNALSGWIRDPLSEWIKSSPNFVTHVSSFLAIFIANTLAIPLVISLILLLIAVIRRWRRVKGTTCTSPPSPPDRGAQ